MSTSYPSGLDAYTTKVDNVDDVLAAHMNDVQDAIEALEAKVGVDSSAITSSHDYKLRNLPSQDQDWDAGSHEIRAETLEADIATGTAPLTITSTTKVNNLNADKVDGLDSTDIVQMTGDQSIAGVKTFNSFPITPSSAPTTDYQVANKKYVDDNAGGVADGEVTPTKLGYLVGNTLLSSADTLQSLDSGTWTKKKEIRIVKNGTLRIKFDLRVTNYTGYGKIYRNGTPIGTQRSVGTNWTTFSEDISDWVAGQKCQLYIRRDQTGTSVQCRNFRIYCSCPTVEEVLLD